MSMPFADFIHSNQGVVRFWDANNVFTQDESSKMLTCHSILVVQRFDHSNIDAAIGSLMHILQICKLNTALKF